MAILSATELTASREAIEAGVADVDEEVAESAIALSEARMNVALGYRVANDETSITIVSSSAGGLLTVPERIRSLSAVTDTFPGSAPIAVSNYAIRNNGFTLYRAGFWRPDNSITLTGAFGYAEDDDKYILAKQFVLLLAVRYLASTAAAVGGAPNVPGALLTGFSSQSAQFTFFTPSGDTTGYQDLDQLLAQIGKHPSKSKGLWTLPVGPAEHDLGPEAVWLGLETP